MKNIVAICENEECINVLKEAGSKLGCNILSEIQNNGVVSDKLSADIIKDSDAILFVLGCSIEEVEDIERFIDCEYYEVDPTVVINTPDIVLKEIISDLD